MNDCHILFFTLRFIASVSVSQLILWLAMTKGLWPYMTRHNPQIAHLPHTPTWLLGLIERLLYMISLFVGAPQFIGVWLVLKATVRWRAVKDDKEYGTATDIVWLIGTGLNLLTAVVGVFVSLWHIPTYRNLP
jgi:hypothetical protein